MKTIHIQVPDMQSTHCQLRVEQAIKKNTPAQLENSGSGFVDVLVNNESELNQVTQAIREAGYTVETVGPKKNGTDALRFKTNIHCGGCVSKVTPALNEKAGIGNWQVDTTDPNKILTVNGGNLSTDEVIRIIREAGYQIEAVV